MSSFYRRLAGPTGELRGEAKLPINTIAAHFLVFSPAAVQSWHYEINFKVLETEGEMLTDRSTNKQNSTGVKSTP